MEGVMFPQTRGTMRKRTMESQERGEQPRVARSLHPAGSWAPRYFVTCEREWDGPYSNRAVYRKNKWILRKWVVRWSVSNAKLKWAQLLLVLLKENQQSSEDQMALNYLGHTHNHCCARGAPMHVINSSYTYEFKFRMDM